MSEAGLGFQAALAEARKAGFAEADPTFDVEGIDAAQKLSILGSLAIGQWVAPDKVYTEGITHLQPLDTRLIRDRFKSTIKLLGIGERSNNHWTFRVHPALIRQSHPFANVRNEYNAIMLHGNATEDVMLYGKGAGRLPTSSAVISDLIFLCRQIANQTAGDLPYVTQSRSGQARLGTMAQVQCRYYIRVSTQDHPGVLSKITGILGKHGVSLASVHQDSYEKSMVRRGVPVILLTHVSRESGVRASIKAIDRLPTTISKSILLRME